jgi:DNA-binding PucR family transcriptional regulator
MARFVKRTLAPLEAIRAPWLEPTLEAYISRQGRIKEAALELRVHPNTIKYRLGEIREALGPVLHDPARSRELLTALRLRRLMA